MPSGILGAVDLAAATNTTLYTVPAGKVASLAMNFCNRGTASTTVRLAIGSSATPAATDWLIYDAVIPPNGSVERTGIVLDAAKLVVVYSSNANVTATAYGYEE